jgi:hypothetical protein
MFERIPTRPDRAFTAVSTTTTHCETAGKKLLTASECRKPRWTLDL